MNQQASTENTSGQWQQRAAKLQSDVSQEARYLLDGAGKLVIIDLIVGFLFIFRSIGLFSQSFVALVLLVYVAYRATTKPVYTVRYSNIVVAVFLIGFFYIFVASIFAGESTTMQVFQRLMRMLAVVGLAIFIADGRVHFRSLLLGFSIGLLFNAIGFYAGVAPADYGSYLTGWVQDKNVAGLYYAVVPLLMFVLFTKPWQRIALVMIALPLLWETGSRTSLGGFALGVLWLLFAGRLNLFFKFVMGGLVMWLFEWAQANFADSAAFGDRSGTDWFREQIDNASWEKVQGAPWHGLGLGQAFAEVEGHNNQYFHNSFWTLYVEGGWPWLIAVLGITLFAVFIWKQQKTPRTIGAEAAMVLLLICSWRLGEVILTMPWGLVMGLALSYMRESNTEYAKSIYTGDSRWQVTDAKKRGLS